VSPTRRLGNGSEKKGAGGITNQGVQNIEKTGKRDVNADVSFDGYLIQPMTSIKYRGGTRAEEKHRGKRC